MVPDVEELCQETLVNDRNQGQLWKTLKGQKRPMLDCMSEQSAILERSMTGCTSLLLWMAADASLAIHDNMWCWMQGFEIE